MISTEKHLTPDSLAELRRLARSRPKSGRAQLAKLGALRTLERLAREEAALKRREPTFLFPWESASVVETGTVLAVFELYAWSEAERVLFGALSGPQGRPEYEEDQIRALVERFEAADDPPAAFRDWLEAVGD